MALFQKKPQVSLGAPLYTVGASRAFLIIGLGNPGKKYDGTRHNIGFGALDNFAKANEFPKWVNKKDLKVQITANNLGPNRVILCKPSTYMNLSGQAASAVQQFYKLANSQTLAVYDELAIPFGQLRTRLGGSDAGHNGVKSLIEQIGEDFGRLRIGIGSDEAKKTKAETFVLKKFNKEEQGKLPIILQELNAMVTEFIFSGGLPHDTRSVL